MQIDEILKQTQVIPVMVINDLDDAIPLANALISGGLKVLEITLRTPVALEAIALIKDALPDSIIGSGTVIDPKTLNDSLNVGVDFMVSPGINNELLNEAKLTKAKLLPGAATPTEVMSLMSAGFNSMKFFPAEAAGGTKMLKSIEGPLPQVTFCPTGGINLQNAPAYLELNNVACVGGTWMLDKSLIQQKNWEQINQLAIQASQLNVYQSERKGN